MAKEDVFGWWTTRKSFSTQDQKCSKCKVDMEEVPKEGHPNSKYWELQQHKDEVLVACPKRCLEGEHLIRNIE